MSVGFYHSFLASQCGHISDVLRNLTRKGVIAGKALSIVHRQESATAAGERAARPSRPHVGVGK